MAKVIVTLKIMPSSPETNLEEIKERAKQAIRDFGGEVGKEEVVPVAFGLKSLSLVFVMEEEVGGTEALEKKIADFPGVSSVAVVDVRRAIG
jgi:elongation factor 1-beta